MVHALIIDTVLKWKPRSICRPVRDPPSTYNDVSQYKRIWYELITNELSFKITGQHNEPIGNPVRITSWNQASSNTFFIEGIIGHSIYVLRVTPTAYCVYDGETRLLHMTSATGSEFIRTKRLYFTLIDLSTTIQRFHAMEIIQESPLFDNILMGRCVELQWSHQMHQTILSGEENVHETHEFALDTFRNSKSGMYLWQGPPGAGKTWAIARMVRDQLNENRTLRFLLCAHSNRAVINIINALLKAGLPVASISWIVSKEHLKEPITPILNALTTTNRKNASIHVCTCYLSNRLKDVYEYDVVALDEAAFCPESDGLFPISIVKNGGKVLLVGDVEQLTPVLKSCATTVANHSLMGRCFTTSPYNLVTFNQSYRVGAVACAYLQEAYYHKRIKKLLSAPKIVTDKILLDYPATEKFPEIVFIDVEGDCLQNGTSFVNHTNAMVVISIAEALVARIGINPNNIQIVTPYTAQQSCLQSFLSDPVNLALAPIGVSTVHSMQGSEEMVVIYDLVRTGTETGFLNNAHLTCVGTSRQKVFLIVVGMASSLAENREWTFLINRLKLMTWIITQETLNQRLTNLDVWNDGKMKRTPPTKRRRTDFFDDVRD